MLKIKSNEMNKRRSSLPSTDLKQTGITQFVEREVKKDQPIKFIGTRRSSQTSTNSVQTPETSSSTESAPKKEQGHRCQALIVVQISNPANDRQSTWETMNRL